MVCHLKELYILMHKSLSRKPLICIISSIFDLLGCRSYGKFSAAKFDEYYLLQFVKVPVSCRFPSVLDAF